MKLGILVSGDLGFYCLKKILNHHKISFVMTDKNSVFISNYCLNKKIPCFIGNPRNNKSSSFILNKNIDVLISINYLFLIEEDLISLPKILAFNIHGSLLPKYRGRTPHVWAIINGDKQTGISAHIIEKECDKGSILFQLEINIGPTDTGADILEIFKRKYPKIILKVLKDIKKDSIVKIQQKEELATYFPKRSPEDGKINFKLSSNEIYNWVRAQAFPYPGAFLFYNNNKIIIDKIKIINNNYDKKLPNGFIIKVNPLIIKVSDGLIELTKIRNSNNLFELNKKFN
jgi:methionyl-tRNA formyltransferase